MSGGYSYTYPLSRPYTGLTGAGNDSALPERPDLWQRGPGACVLKGALLRIRNRVQTWTIPISGNLYGYRGLFASVRPGSDARRGVGRGLSGGSPPPAKAVGAGPPPSTLTQSGTLRCYGVSVTPSGVVSETSSGTGAPSTRATM